jgi:alpha-1,3-fucosyltransferase 10
MAQNLAPLLVCAPTRYFGAAQRMDRFPQLPGVRWSSDVRAVPRADVVIVHLPDYAYRGRIRKYPHQIWVAWCMESGASYPVLDDARFMAQFDLVMSHRRTADIWMSYLPGRPDWEAMGAVPPATFRRDAAVAAFVSSSVDFSDRRRLMAELAATLPVHSYGTLFHNRDVPPPDTGRASKLATLAQYPFALAFENACEPDYVTEKIFDAYWAGAIPVYLGAPNIADFVPQGSFIDASRYANGRALGAHLAFLATQPAELAKFHAWRRQPLPPHLVAMCEHIAVSPFEQLIARVRSSGLCANSRQNLPGLQVALDHVGRFLRPRR